MLIPEGKAKTPVISLQQLAEIFLRDTTQRAVPITFGELTVSPEYLGVMTELVSSFELFSKFEVLANEEGGKDHTTISDVTFDDTYLFSILGQVLYIREYCRQQWTSSGESCPLPNLVIATRSFGRSTDDGKSIAVFDWFLKGGNRDNIPDTEDELKATTNASFGKFEPGRKPGKPGQYIYFMRSCCFCALNSFIFPLTGKGEPEIPSSSSISALLWIKSPYTLRDLFSEEPKVYDISSFNKFQSALNMYEIHRNAAEGMYEPAAAERAVLDFASKHAEMSVVFARNGETDWPCQFEERGVSIIDANVNFVYFELLSALISVLLDSPNFNSESSIEYNPCQSQIVYEKAILKRQSLTAAQICTLQHSVKENEVNTDDLYDVLKDIYSNSNDSTFLEGGLFMATCMALESLYSELRNNEALLISGFKMADERWIKLVEEFERDSKFDVSELKTAACDLQCAVGDTLDERHMHWLEGVTNFEMRAHDDAQSTTSNLVDILSVLAQTSFTTFEKHCSIVRNFTSVLRNAGYDSFPFLLSSKTMKGGRMNLQRRRDELKTVSLSCQQFLNLSYSNSSLEVASPWAPIASLEISANNDLGTILQDGMTELLFNTLDRSRCLVVAYKEAIEHIHSMITDLGSCLRRSTLIRHNYEHEYLQRWSKDLMQSTYSVPSASEPNSLSGFAQSQAKSASMSSTQSLFVPRFKPSIDVKDDGIVWKDGRGALELGEMTLNIDTTKEFAHEMVSRLSTDPSASFIEFVRYSVQALEKRNCDISYPWKHSEKVTTFLRNIIGDEHVEVRGKQHQHCCTLVSHLVLGILPKGFSDRTIKFLLNEGKNLLPDKQDDDEEGVQGKETRPIVSKEMFMKKIAAAPHLKEEYGAENFNMYFGALEALVTSVTKNEANLCLYEFLSLVCRSVVLPLIVSLDINLINQTSDLELECGLKKHPNRQHPTVVRPGVSKVGILARYLRDPSSSDRLPEQLNPALGFPLESSQISACFGPIKGSILSEKCAKINLVSEESNNRTECESMYQFRTFENEVIFLAELPTILDQCETCDGADVHDVLFREYG